jgi:WD40 repeat protein
MCPDNGYLYSIDWSPNRPCVFACGSHKGNVLVYDLAKSGSNLSATLVASDKPVHVVSFNEHREGYLASGDRNGVVKIWRLSNELTKVQVNDMKTLNDISEKPFQKEAT